MFAKRFDRFFLLLALALLTTLSVACHSSRSMIDAFGREPVSRRAELRVLTLNVEMLPWPVGDTDEGLERVRLIAGQIREVQAPYDVVVLTECFDETLRAEFVRLLSPEFPHSVSRCATTDPLRQDSGLCLFSRYPIKRHRGLDLHDFEAFPFELSGTADMMAAKGVLGVPIDLSEVEENRVVWIFVTHLQSDPGEVGEYAGIRAGQLERVLRFMDDRVYISPRDWDVSVLLTGDLNVAGGRAERARMMAILGEPRDLFLECRKGEDGATWIDPNGPGLRLDYFFAFDRLPGRTDLRPFVVRDCRVQSFAADGRDLSDHHGLVALAM